MIANGDPSAQSSTNFFFFITISFSLLSCICTLWFWGIAKTFRICSTFTFLLLTLIGRVFPFNENSRLNWSKSLKNVNAMRTWSTLYLRTFHCARCMNGFDCFCFRYLYLNVKIFRKTTTRTEKGSNPLDYWSVFSNAHIEEQHNESHSVFAMTTCQTGFRCNSFTD